MFYYINIVQNYNSILQLFSDNLNINNIQKTVWFFGCHQLLQSLYEYAKNTVRVYRTVF